MAKARHYRQRHEREAQGRLGIEKRQHWHKQVNCGGVKLALRIQDYEVSFSPVEKVWHLVTRHLRKETPKTREK